MPSSKRMSLSQSLRVLKSIRTDEVVVTAMSTAREWMELGSHPLDFVYVPSSMGQAPGLGLGVALARPDRQVIVCNGDGSTLMNLGSLVTISAQPASNFVLLLFDNGVYEVTGIQQTPGSAEVRSDGTDVDFAAIARACGFRSVFEFDELELWRSGAQRVLQAQGPTIAVLRVAPVTEAGVLRSPGPAKDRALQFAAALKGEPPAAG